MAMSAPWTTKDVAKRLRVSQTTLRSWRRQEKGPPFIQPAGKGTTPLYDPKEVEKFAAAYKEELKRRKRNGR